MNQVRTENVSAGPTTGEAQNIARRFFRDGKELTPQELPMQEAAAKNVEIRNSELDVILPSNRKITILGNAKPLLDDAGKVRGCLGTFVDITERKKAEETLTKKQDELQTIIDSSQGLIFYKDLENHFIRVNKAFAEIMGLPKEQLEGRSLFELYPKEEAEAFWSDDKQVIASGKAKVGIEEKMLSKMGQRWVQTDKIPYRDAKGNIIGVIGFSLDITERKKALENLERERFEFRSILDFAPVMIAYKSKDDHFVQVNSAFADFVGLPKEKIIGKTTFDLVKEKDVAQQGRDSDLQVMRTGVPVLNQIIKWSGLFSQKQIWALYSKMPFHDSDGNVVGTVSYVLDVDETKKAEEALNKLNEELEERVLKRTEQVSVERQRLYNVLETLPAYVILLDKDYCVPFANKVFRERFGESNGRRCYDFLFKRESPCENCETYKVLKTNGPHRWEWTGPDGRDYDIYDFPFVETDGSTLILEMGIDITERKRAEKQVRDVSFYSRSLLEASLDPLVTISAEGKITDVNQATELATGCSREELIGSDFSDYFTEPEKAKIGYKQVFNEGFVRDYPLAIKHKSGKITDVLYNATIYTNEAGEMQGVFAAARDITERKKAEEQAQEAAKKLKDSERLAAIGATAGMVGHDIRNPLQAITGDLFLAKSELSELPENENKTNAIESLDEIQNNIDYINKIVADLQDYARPLNPRAQETNIKSLFHDILAKNGIPKNIEVTVKVEDKAEKIMADPDYLKRIAANLTLNAVQAMPDGGKLTIHAYVDKATDDVLITVKDTGVGIPEDIKPKLFTPMMTTKSKGQGFGLAVVKRMTEGLGGTVAFESTEGKGTTFIVRLPPPKELNGKLVYK